jgi:hypothetical protein
MDDEGLLIEVTEGRVSRVLTNGTPLPAGAIVTYNGRDVRALPISIPSGTDEIERFVKAQREGRANTQRHGIRTACDTAYRHYQAIAQATGVLASLLADFSLVREGDPAALAGRVKDAVDRIDDDLLREVRNQLLLACDAAMELRVPTAEDAEEEYAPPLAIPTLAEAIEKIDAGAEEFADEEHYELPRVMQQQR